MNPFCVYADISGRRSGNMYCAKHNIIFGFVQSIMFCIFQPLVFLHHVLMEKPVNQKTYKSLKTTDSFVGIKLFAK